MSETARTPRAAVLTEADHLAIAEMLNKHHTCRFDNVSCEDMDFVKDLLVVYKETRSEVIKWIVKGIVYGTLLLVMVGAYFKWGGHK